MKNLTKLFAIGIIDTKFRPQEIAPPITGITFDTSFATVDLGNFNPNSLSSLLYDGYQKICQDLFSVAY